MKTLTSLLLTVVFSLGMVSVQAGQVNSSSGVQKTFSIGGDGIDNRHCAMLEKQGKKPTGMCF